MKHGMTWAAVALLAMGTLAAGQTRDAGQVLAGAREAMGGDKLAAVRTLTATGRTQRTTPAGTMESEFELSLELPDKYLMRTVMAAMGNMSVYRNTGFSGGQVIEEIDRPPNLSGGMVMIRLAGPGGAAVDPDKMTPEQKAEFDKTRLLANRKEYARLALGLFAAPPAVYPMEMTHAGEAEAPDGKADVLDLKGEGGFAARLFVDRQTRLPLMLSWHDKEPLVMRVSGPGQAGPAAAGGGGHASDGVNVNITRGPGMANMSKEEREKFEQELEAKRKEAEAARRVVEFRVYYADYQEVDGIRLPHRIQRSIDGKPTEEMIFESVKVNAKIDAKKFQVTK